VPRRFLTENPALLPMYTVEDRVPTIRFTIEDRRYEVDIEALFAADHEYDLIGYYKYLSATYAVWAELREKAKLILISAQNRLNLRRAQTRLDVEEHYRKREMKPIQALLEARVTTDPSVMKAMEEVEYAERQYRNAKVVTETLQYQRSLVTRELEGD
jgi:hypothetical protein